MCICVYKRPGNLVPTSFLTETSEVLARNCHRHKVDHFEEHQNVLVCRVLEDALEVIIE